MGHILFWKGFRGRHLRRDDIFTENLNDDKKNAHTKIWRKKEFQVK